ncbi:hypothetical protein Q4485_12860 [Granulosicoccaceae sp. 1_MG-2023]|nr:hypothetical protein [Granulosicoccaceae sp. 1_MG-2023]
MKFMLMTFYNCREVPDAARGPVAGTGRFIRYSKSSAGLKNSQKINEK